MLLKKSDWETVCKVNCNYLYTHKGKKAVQSEIGVTALDLLPSPFVVYFCS